MREGSERAVRKSEELWGVSRGGVGAGRLMKVEG